MTEGKLTCWQCKEEMNRSMFRDPKRSPAWCIKCCTCDLCGEELDEQIGFLPYGIRAII